MATIDDITVEFKANTRNLDRGIDRSDRGLKGMTRNARLATAAIAAIGGSQALRGLVNLTRRGGEVANVMRATERATGSLDGTINTLRASTKGLVSDFDLAVGLNRALTLGAASTAQEYGELAKTGIALGKALGVDAASAVESLSLGIGRQSKLILDNLGLIVSVEQANEKYAASIGKTVDALTDSERREAFRTAALEAAREKVDELGTASENNADKVQQLAVAFSNLRDQIGRTLSSSTGLGSFLDGIGGFFQGYGDILQRNRTGVSIEAIQRNRSNALIPNLEGVRRARGTLTAEALGGQISATDFAFLNKGLTDLERTFTAADRVADELENVAEAAKEAARAVKDMGGAAKLDGEQIMKRLSMRPDVINRTAPFSTRGGGGGINVGEIGGAGSSGGPGLFDRVFGDIDPGRIAESALGNLASSLLSGGISSVLSSVMGGIGNALFGDSQEDAELKALREALKSNEDAIRKNTRSQTVSSGIFSEFNAGELNALIGQFFGNNQTAGRRAFPRSEIERLAEILNLDVPEAGSPMYEEFIDQIRDAFGQALGFGNQFSGAFDLFQREIGLLDLDPDEQFAGIADLLDQIGASDGLKAFFDSLSADNIDSEISRIFEQIRTGNIDQILTLLGDDLSLTQFIELLTFAEGALDNLGNTADDVAGALRNVPSGFKVALETFRATQAGRGGRGGGGFARPFDDLDGRGGVDPGIPMMNGNVTVNITAQGADAQEVYDVFERELARKVRRGGTPRTSLVA